MSLRSHLGGSSFEGGVRLMDEGTHVGTIKIAALRNSDDFDLTVNSTERKVSVSAAVTLNSLQLLALVEQLTEAVKSKGVSTVDTRPEPEGAA